MKLGKKTAMIKEIGPNCRGLCRFGTSGTFLLSTSTGNGFARNTELVAGFKPEK